MLLEITIPDIQGSEFATVIVVNTPSPAGIEAPENENPKTTPVAALDETVKPDDNYDLNVTYNSDNYLASFNSDKIHENTLPLNKKYVSKFNKDKNKNIRLPPCCYGGIP